MTHKGGLLRPNVGVAITCTIKGMHINYTARLLNLLPLHAEEDATREAISTAELILQLSPFESDQKEAAAVLSTVRRLFDALCLLDQRPAMQDQWAFVSFSASLLGHSLVRVLASPNQTLCPAYFWRDDGDQSPDRIEAQRQLLHTIESGRVQFCADGKPEPIRFVYVAWGLIRLGSQFLLVHRDDQTRPDVSNYVFPGGRFRLDDLPMAQQTAASLRSLHCNNSAVALAALPRTLNRELSEEIGLVANDHYSSQQRRVIGPYHKVEGARNRHAYTAYQLVLHDIRLTARGEARVLERAAAEPDRLVWFSVDDIVASSGRADGKQAFVDALREQLGEDLTGFLDATPDSGGTPYRLSGDAHATDIPASLGQAFRIGKTGDERTVLIPMSAAEGALLWTIMAHAKGLQLSVGERHLKLLGGGWIKLCSADAEQTTISLFETLSRADFPLIQRVEDDFVRSTIDPGFLYFSEDAFRYRLTDHGQSGELLLSLAKDLAPWGEIAPASLRIALNRNMTKALLAIGATLELPPGYSEEAMKKGIKEMLDSKTRPFGLRKLVRTAATRYRITVPKAE